MPGYLFDHLLKNYQGKGIFILNDNEVKMGLRDVELISGMMVVKTNFKLIEAKELHLRIDFCRN